MHLTPADIILLAAIVVVAPAYSYYAGIRIMRGALRNRTLAYARTMLTWWLVALATLFLWWRLDRPFPKLGLAFKPGPAAIAAAIVCVLIVAYMNGQMRVVAKLSPEKLAHVRDALAHMAAVLPHTLGEYRVFLAVSATAGICEELLYRGYFFAVVGPLISIPSALLASAIVFGLGHLYQGRRGFVKTLFAGIFFGLVYVTTGSLLWPVLIHMLLDIQGGTLGYRVLRRSGESAPGS